MSATLCDGCGRPASAEHIAARIRRLELATRFRPVHIVLLILAEAPPPRVEDYFYYPAATRNERTGLSRVLFDELMQAAGIPLGQGDASCLTAFQQSGLFLADSLECPVEDIVPGLRDGTARADPRELCDRCGPTIVQRVRLSYKPRCITLLSTRTRHLIPHFERAGLSKQLLLYQGLPLHFPHPHNPAAQAQFRAGLADILARAGLQKS